MGLRKCKDCDKEISESATKCPHCGALHADVTGIVAVVVIILLVLAGAMFLINANGC